MPGSTAAAGHVAQLPRDSQRDECRSPTPWCFPLAPEGSPQSQADPASESNQHLGRFAKAEIAAPAQHIPSQFFHCRLDADALGPSRDVSDSLLKPVQRFRRNRALDVRTSRKAEPEELPFLRSCHRTLRLIYLELELLCDEARDAFHHPLKRPSLRPRRWCSSASGRTTAPPRRPSSSCRPITKACSTSATTRRSATSDNSSRSTISRRSTAPSSVP